MENETASPLKVALTGGLGVIDAELAKHPSTMDTVGDAARMQAMVAIARMLQVDAVR